MIRLEPLQPDHAVEMLPGLSNGEAYRFLPDLPPADLAELTERYVRQARGRSDDGSELWYNWIIRNPGSDTALGYTQATIRAHAALVAYHVFPAYWRSGVGYAAMSETIDQLFLRLRVDRAWALVDTRNAASAALLKKLGFAVTHRHEAADFFKGAVSDELEFELTRSAWLAHSH
jgi:RimJ/RimL family protein N-acetyltransferase